MKIVEWILFLIVLTFCVVLLMMSVAIFQVFVVDATEGGARSWGALLMAFSCAAGAVALAWPILLEPLYRWLFKAYDVRTHVEDVSMSTVKLTTPPLCGHPACDAAFTATGEGGCVAPGYHCDHWDAGKKCCYCGSDGEDGTCGVNVREQWYRDQERRGCRGRSTLYEPPKIHMGWPDEYDSRN